MMGIQQRSARNCETVDLSLIPMQSERTGQRHIRYHSVPVP